MIEKIIRKIADQAKSKYLLRRIELRQEWESKGYKVYFAHELCSCPKKRELAAAFPELRDTISLKPPVMIGEMIELAVKTLLNLKGLDLHKTIGRYVIFGGIDMYDPDTKSVYDIKYTTGDPIPKDEHVLRVAVYKYLAETDKGYLLYISPRGFKEYQVTRTLDDSSIVKLIQNNKAPMWSKECMYCTYREFCSFSSGVEKV